MSVSTSRDPTRTTPPRRSRTAAEPPSKNSPRTRAMPSPTEIGIRAPVAKVAGDEAAPGSRPGNHHLPVLPGDHRRDARRRLSRKPRRRASIEERRERPAVAGRRQNQRQTVIPTAHRRADERLAAPQRQSRGQLAPLAQIRVGEAAGPEGRVGLTGAREPPQEERAREASSPRRPRGRRSRPRAPRRSSRSPARRPRRSPARPRRRCRRGPVGPQSDQRHPLSASGGDDDLSVLLDRDSTVDGQTRARIFERMLGVVEHDSRSRGKPGVKGAGGVKSAHGKDGAVDEGPGVAARTTVSFRGPIAIAIGRLFSLGSVGVMSTLPLPMPP